MSNLKKFRSSKGFTLIELMIVVAIIGILAAIAIPNFIRYQLKSKTSEARTNIGGIKTSQESFRATEDFYITTAAAVPAAIPGTVKVAWPEAVGACAGCSRATPAGCTLFDCMGFRPAGGVYFSYTTVGTAVGAAPEFCAQAQGDLDGDGTNSEFEMGSSNNGAAPFDCPNATGLCGTVPTPGEVYHCLADIF